MNAWGWLKLLLMDFEWSAFSPPPVLEASHPIPLNILCLHLAGSCSPVYQLTHNQMGTYLNFGKAPPTSWIWSITIQTPLSNEVTHTAENRAYQPHTPRLAALLLWQHFMALGKQPLFAPRTAGVYLQLVTLVPQTGVGFFHEVSSQMFCWRQTNTWKSHRRAQLFSVEEAICEEEQHALPQHSHCSLAACLALASHHRLTHS